MMHVLMLHQDGKITGTEAAYLFLASGLTSEELGEIWRLCDINRDHCLDVEEYVIAQLLVKARLDGHLKRIPHHLPNKLRRIANDIRRELINKRGMSNHDIDMLSSCD